MPIPLILGALGAGALKALTDPKVAGQLGRGIMGAFDPSAKMYRDELREDRRRLKANDFGMSEAQKDTALSATMRQQQAAARGTEAALRQQASAMGPRSGAAMEAIRGMGTDLAGQAAGARGQIESTSSQMAVQQKAQAMDRLNQRRQEKAGMAEAATSAIAQGAGQMEAGYRGMREYQKDYAKQKEEAGLNPPYDVPKPKLPAMTAGYQSQLDQADADARLKRLEDLLFAALGGKGEGYR